MRRLLTFLSRIFTRLRPGIRRQRIPAEIGEVQEDLPGPIVSEAPTSPDPGSSASLAVETERMAASPAQRLRTIDVHATPPKAGHGLSSWYAHLAWNRRPLSDHVTRSLPPIRPEELEAIDLEQLMNQLLWESNRAADSGEQP